MAQEQRAGTDQREDWMVCLAEGAVLYEKACQKYVKEIIRLRNSYQERHGKAAR